MHVPVLQDPLENLRELTTSLSARLLALSHVDRESLSSIICANPALVPILATFVNLTQEQLKNQLRFALGSSSWIAKAKVDPLSIITFLDEQFDLVAHVDNQLRRSWSLDDVLVERYLWSRGQAASSVTRGRRVEDEVENVVKGLELPYETRTRFAGRNARTAPCDIAIPSAREAAIVGCAKGFNSTGSKLTDAVREVQEMAEIRLPRQFTFALIDGIGWHNRIADLKRIHDLWLTDAIDGLYSLNMLSVFREDIAEQAKIRGIA